MTSISDILQAVLKKRSAILSIVIAALVVIIWFFAFFLPQGKKISTLDAKEQTLLAQVTAGNAKVAALKHTAQHATQLTKTEERLQSYVPSQAGIYDYVANLSTLAKTAGVTVTSVTPSQPLKHGTFTEIAVALRVSGPYDGILKLITAIYRLPRLTYIHTLSISGGGPGTNRSTALGASLSLDAFTTAPPTAKVKQ